MTTTTNSAKVQNILQILDKIAAINLQLKQIKSEESPEKISQLRSTKRQYALDFIDAMKRDFQAQFRLEE